MVSSEMASSTRTPLAFLPSGAINTSVTMDQGLSVSRPVLTAAGSVQIAALVPPLVFTPTADALASEADPGTNFGTQPQLLVDGGDDPDVESYLRFDVTGVDTLIQGATLRLWVPNGGETADGLRIFSAPTAWTEEGLTWDTRPGTQGSTSDRMRDCRETASKQTPRPSGLAGPERASGR